MQRKKIEVSIKRINPNFPLYPQCQYTYLGSPYQKVDDSIENNYTGKLKIPLLISRETQENRPDFDTKKKADTSEKGNLITNATQIARELFVSVMSNLMTGGALSNLISIKGFILKIFPSVLYCILPYTIILLLNFINQTKNSGSEYDSLKASRELKISSWTEVWVCNTLVLLLSVFFILGTSFLYQHGHSLIPTFMFNLAIKMTISIVNAFVIQKMIVNENKENLIFSPMLEESIDMKRITIPVPVTTDKNNHYIQ